MMEDAEIVLVSYGVSARTCLATVDQARKNGIKAGLFRLITIWPFPEEEIIKIAQRVKGFITVEINLGQIHREVQRCVGDKAPAVLVGHHGGTIITPDEVLKKIKETF